MKAIASGFVGAVTLTAIHQIVRRFVPDPPRMDVVGMRALEPLMRFAGLRPPEQPRLYVLTLAGDIVSNSVYYSAVAAGSRRTLWPRAIALGLAAGIGAVVLPEPMGLGKPPHNERITTRLLTVGYYLAGALTAAAAMSISDSEDRAEGIATPGTDKRTRIAS